ncbi:bromodomain associated domain-containing protein [Lojkania enalia]|uniref:Bromodomain associated domain-containing protein n=1 Tax=Lojkania enalia TaxID=147567 RepID=A0A9P4TRP9_9PLEO|nr:bromodomain associated domain-containing protein [Didymosphaeria enalia]
MSTNDLFNTLLRPAVLHILRAAGFHAAKPSIIDTLVDLTARYMFLLASRTAYNAYSNHNDLSPDVTDVRMAMQDCGLLVPTLTGAEEVWKEILRKPLEDYDEETGARAKEAKRRDTEDTADVTEFIDWVKGEYNKEINRIAGMARPTLTATEALDAVEMEDYLNTLMKKHSKTGVESRFQGTVLGNPGDPKCIKIEGGPADSIQDWCRKTRQKAAKSAEATQGYLNQSSHAVETTEGPEDVVMETQ